MDDLLLIALFAVLGCAGASTPPEAAPPGTRAEPDPLPAASPRATALSGVFAGPCEPSAILRYGWGWLIGDNETTDRLLHFDLAMNPTGEMVLPSTVDDIEALAVTPTATWVVGSHSRSKGGEYRPLRWRILDLSRQRVLPLDPSACVECVAATALAPNAGGFNVEGAAAWGTGLVLGLRGPVVGGRALLLPIATEGQDAGRVDRVVQVDLGGDGIRELVPWKDGLLVLSGPVDDDSRDHRLWWMASLDAPPLRLDAALPPSTEGLVPLGVGEVLTVQDGDGKYGECRVPGRWTRIPIVLP